MESKSVEDKQNDELAKFAMVPISELQLEWQEDNGTPRAYNAFELEWGHNTRNTVERGIRTVMVALRNQGYSVGHPLLTLTLKEEKWRRREEVAADVANGHLEALTCFMQERKQELTGTELSSVAFEVLPVILAMTPDELVRLATVASVIEVRRRKKKTGDRRTKKNKEEQRRRGGGRRRRRRRR